MSVENIVLVNDLVRRSNKANADGLRIPIKTKINVAFLEQMCKNTEHEKTTRYMKYGWPLGFKGDKVPPEPVRNHKGARDFPKETKQYIESEKEKGRIAGPFNKKVFRGKNGISPINSVPRKDSNRRRFVLDLSYPRGRSINDGINKDTYEEDSINLKYPTVDDLVDLVVRKKEKSQERILMWKRDLKSCYRQWPLCAGDVHLVGYKINGEYFYDMVLAMGSSSSAQICQKITNMIAQIYYNLYEEEVKNFLDDFGSATEESKALWAFEKLAELFQKMGIEEGLEKACAPATVMVFLGIEFDSETMTIRLTKEKMEEIISELQKWTGKVQCTTRQMQSLVGKLNFAAGVVRSGRVYMQRLINTLRGQRSNRSQSIILSEDAKNDIRWWIEHIALTNGVSMMCRKKWEKLNSSWVSDSSESGIGAWSGVLKEFFHLELAQRWIQQDINIKECLALLVCARIWVPHLRAKRILVQCDNQVTVNIVNSGASKNKWLQACLRELNHICALNSTQIRVIWIKTEQNGLADKLSRWHKHEKYRQQFEEENEVLGMKEVQISERELHFVYTTL